MLNQALARAARWNVARLTNTYLTLGLSEIGSAIGISNEDEVRNIVVSMVCAFSPRYPTKTQLRYTFQIEDDEITATLDAHGTVTFSDPPLRVGQAEVDRVLRAAQAQSTVLSALERELGASEKFLQKALKAKDDDGRWGAADAEEIMALGGAVGGFAEEGMYA